MAFFGITKLGYQNNLREHVRDPVLTPLHVFESGLYRDPKYLLPRLEPRSFVTLPPVGCTDRTCRYGGGHANSSWERIRLQQEFIVNPKEPEQIYRRPIVTSQEIARWRKDEPIKCTEPWTRVKRHVSILSEMSRFVDDVAKKDRLFSLF